MFSGTLHVKFNSENEHLSAEVKSTAQLQSRDYFTQFRVRYELCSMLKTIW